MNQDKQTYLDKKLRPLPRWIFMSRWLQAPLYIGLIVAQGVYVWQFWVELVHLIQMMANKTMTETALMLIVLGLIDVVMISNLLVMVRRRADKSVVKAHSSTMELPLILSVLSICDVGGIS